MKPAVAPVHLPRHKPARSNHSFWAVSGVLLLACGSVVGQQHIRRQAAFQLTGTLAGLPAGSRCTLSYYMGSVQSSIPVGTALTTADGQVRFVLPKSPAPGLYWLNLPTELAQSLPFVIGLAGDLQFQTTASRAAEGMHWLNSPENEAYYRYRQQAAALKPADQQALREQFCTAHPDWFITKWLRSAESPTGPTARTRFFDTFDLTDERLLHTEFFDQRLMDYLQKLTPPVLDSVIRSVDQLMTRAGTNPVVQQAIAGKIAVAYEHPMLFIGSDGVFVHLVDRYYLPRPDLWSAQTRQQLGERADALRPLLVGQIMPDLKFRDAGGALRSLHTVEGRYTILYFYSLDCPHCRQHAPKLAAFQQKMQPRGVQVVTIPVEPDSARWQQFITTYHAESLLNGLNPTTQQALMKQFGVVEYPTDYILDRQKRILAKRINPALFEQLIDYLDKL